MEYYILFKKYCMYKMARYTFCNNAYLIYLLYFFILIIIYLYYLLFKDFLFKNKSKKYK